MERFLLEHAQHVPLLLPFLDWQDVEALSSATRALAVSALRDVFFRLARVVVPTCPRSNSTAVCGILARLSLLARHVAISDPSHLALLRRLPVLSSLRVAHRHDADQDDGDDYDADRLALGREAIAALHDLAGLERLAVDAHVDDLAALLSGMERLQSLDLVVRSQRAHAEPIGNLHNLRSLVLRCGSVGDLRAIGALPRLESLTLTSWGVHDVSAVGRLARLERLDLSCCNIVDLVPIASLHRLCSLKLEETPVTDLSPLAGLTRLQFLSLARSQASDLTPLGARAASLRHLDLSGCTLTLVSAIALLQQLESLKMYSTTWPSIGTEPGVTAVVSCLRFVRVVDARIRPMFTQRPERVRTRMDLAELRHMHFLEHLDLSGDSISGSVLPVPVPSLVSLRVEWGYTHEPDVPLAAVVHPRLRVLHLIRMRLRSLHNLRFAPQLQELRLVDVLMEDLSTLHSAPNLTHFEHSCAMVRGNIEGDDELPRGRPPTLDLTALGALTKLRHLDLSYSSIRSLLPLSTLADLRHVDLSSTDVEDVSPLHVLPLLECIRLRDTEIAGFDGGAFCRVLRELVLPEHVDCRAIRAAAPLLRRLLHPDRDCRWAGHSQP